MFPYSNIRRTCIFFTFLAVLRSRKFHSYVSINPGYGTGAQGLDSGLASYFSFLPSFVRFRTHMPFSSYFFIFFFFLKSCLCFLKIIPFPMFQLTLITGLAHRVQIPDQPQSSFSFRVSNASVLSFRRTRDWRTGSRFRTSIFFSPEFFFTLPYSNVRRTCHFRLVSLRFFLLPRIVPLPSPCGARNGFCRVPRGIVCLLPPRNFFFFRQPIYSFRRFIVLLAIRARRRPYL